MKWLRRIEMMIPVEIEQSIVVLVAAMLLLGIAVLGQLAIQR
jgi:hypothetical protein